MIILIVMRNPVTLIIIVVIGVPSLGRFLIIIIINIILIIAIVSLRISFILSIIIRIRIIDIVVEIPRRFISICTVLIVSEVSLVIQKFIGKQLKP